jgi:hypothetical protein
MNGLRILDRGAAGWLIDDFSAASFAAPVRLQPTQMHRPVTVRSDDRKGLRIAFTHLVSPGNSAADSGDSGSVPGYAGREGETDPLGAGGMRCQARAEGLTRWQVA